MLANLRPVYRPLLPVCRAAAAPAAGESPRRAGRVLQHGSTAARRHGGVFCSRLVPDISPAQPRCSSFPSTLFRNPAQNSIRAIHFWSDYILHEYLEKLDGIFQHNLHPHDLFDCPGSKHPVAKREREQNLRHILYICIV